LTKPENQCLHQQSESQTRWKKRFYKK